MTYLIRKIIESDFPQLKNLLNKYMWEIYQREGKGDIL
jgi:hypothetical protein